VRANAQQALAQGLGVAPLTLAHEDMPSECFDLSCRKVEEEDEVDSEEEDEFYDRTTIGQGKKQKVAPLVHDAASLFGRKVVSLDTTRHVTTPECSRLSNWKAGF